MTHRPPHRRRRPDPLLQSGTEDGQPPGTACTCTGGPYVHGPKGRRLVLQQIADQKTEGDDDHA